MKNSYNIIIKNNNLKIYINDIIFLSIKHNQLIGFQSWILGQDIKKYCIEFYTTSGDILTEFDDYNKWKEILHLLDINELFAIQF